MKHINKFENSEKIVLKDSIGEIVLDYLKLIESGNIESAKKYLIQWTGGNVRMVWDGESYVPSTITTLRRFITPNSKEYMRKRGYDVIEITKKLLDEIKNESK